MDLTRIAVTLVSTALLSALAGCGEQRSPEPEMTQSAPDDSTYTGSAGRTEDGAAATQSATGEAADEPPKQ